MQAISILHPPSGTTIIDRIYQCPQDCAVYEAEAVQSYVNGDKIYAGIMQCADADVAIEQAKQCGPNPFRLTVMGFCLTSIIFAGALTHVFCYRVDAGCLT